jgi:IS605 OrfB family transposase
MILTYKIKHNLNLKEELRKAKQIAEFAVKTKSRSSKDVKHFGLKSVIANQILKKYASNKKIKSVKSVKLTIPSQAIKLENNFIRIPCLKSVLSFDKKVIKINQIEMDETYAYVSCTVSQKEEVSPKTVLAIDLNATKHIAVMSNPDTGKVWKLGKKASHIRNKYKNIRKQLQKKKKFKKIKSLGNKEQRIIKDLNHKISSKIVKEAVKQNAEIVLEDLKGIRNNKKHRKSFNHTLHSWSFHQLKTFIEYKAKLNGVKVVKIDPRYTSQQCSKCGLLGERRDKLFKCPHCGHVDNADVNASFVIALRHQGKIQSILDRDSIEGNLTLPKEALEQNDSNLRTPRL